jgi:hypothetical protein
MSTQTHLTNLLSLSPTTTTLDFTAHLHSFLTSISATTLQPLTRQIQSLAAASRSNASVRRRGIDAARQYRGVISIFSSGNPGDMAETLGVDGVANLADVRILDAFRRGGDRDVGKGWVTGDEGEGFGGVFAWTGRGEGSGGEAGDFGGG